MNDFKKEILKIDSCEIVSEDIKNLMNCKYFGSCASCTLYDKNYDEQLNYKIQREKNRFSNLTTCDFDIIKSASKNFRNRAEFRVWWEKDENNDKDILTYAMNDFKLLKVLNHLNPL